MKAARRAGVVLGSICAALVTLAAGFPARADDAPDWDIAATVHYGPSGNASGYSAVIAAAKDNAWVFGGTNPGGPSTPAAEHWNGRRWQAWRLPAGLDGFITAAAASSASNVWAVGEGYALRWNGSRWSVAKSWGQADAITSVAAISRSDVWVFGSSSFSGEPSVGAWRYNGRTWARAGGIADAIYRASAVSASDIWAITVSPRGGAVVNYNGTTWSEVSAADAVLANTQLNDVLAASPSNVWVSGTSPANAAEGRLVLAHWNGKSWKRFVAPWLVQQTERFATDGVHGIWIPVVTGGTDPTTWILHLSHAGRWIRTEIAAGRGDGVGVGDLALVPRTTTVWGAGGLVTRMGGDAAIWDLGVLIDHLAAHERRPAPSPSVVIGRGVIRVYLTTGNHPIVWVYLTARPSICRAAAGRPARFAADARD
jgi:hypothetical protein